MSSTSSQPLHQAIHRMDRMLTPALLQQLGLSGIKVLLGELQTFYVQTLIGEIQDTEAPSIRLQPERQRLVAAGCRLGVDLNEALQGRLADLLNAQDAQIEALSEQLRETFRQRLQTMELLKQTQAVRHQSYQAAESAGLGPVL